MTEYNICASPFSNTEATQHSDGTTTEGLGGGGVQLGVKVHMFVSGWGCVLIQNITEKVMLFFFGVFVKVACILQPHPPHPPTPQSIPPG